MPSPPKFKSSLARIWCIFANCCVVHLGMILVSTFMCMECVFCVDFIMCRDESGSDRIILFSHPYPYFFVGCEADITRMRLRMRLFRMSEIVRSWIGRGLK
jgi:hypothetical protein